jgi:hypothetical protein
MNNKLYGFPFGALPYNAMLPLSEVFVATVFLLPEQAYITTANTLRITVIRFAILDV